MLLLLIVQRYVEGDKIYVCRVQGQHGNLGNPKKNEVSSVIPNLKTIKANYLVKENFCANNNNKIKIKKYGDNFIELQNKLTS